MDSRLFLALAIVLIAGVQWTLPDRESEAEVSMRAYMSALSVPGKSNTRVDGYSEVNDVGYRVAVAIERWLGDIPSGAGPDGKIAFAELREIVNYAATKSKRQATEEMADLNCIDPKGLSIEEIAECNHLESLRPVSVELLERMDYLMSVDETNVETFVSDGYRFNVSIDADGNRVAFSDDVTGCQDAQGNMYEVGETLTIGEGSKACTVERIYRWVDTKSGDSNSPN